MHTDLTERELEIAICLSKGLGTKQIANKFQISIFTVKNHQKNIKRKLDSKNLFQAGYQFSEYLGC